jgi:hypothetical protein
MRVKVAQGDAQGGAPKGVAGYGSPLAKLNEGKTLDETALTSAGAARKAAQGLAKLARGLYDREGPRRGFF